MLVFSSPEFRRRHEVSEAPGPLQVQAVPRHPVEEEEGVAVAGHAVAYPGALLQQSLLPYALTASVTRNIEFLHAFKLCELQGGYAKFFILHSITYLSAACLYFSSLSVSQALAKR